MAQEIRQLQDQLDRSLEALKEKYKDKLQKLKEQQNEKQVNTTVLRRTV